MSYPINYPTPQGANIQIFNVSAVLGVSSRKSWIKPQGASFVWFTLIGAGGGGGGTDGASGVGNGGGSGAVTNCMVPAFLIPDELQIYVGGGGTGGDNAGNNGNDGQPSYVSYLGATYQLLLANGGFGGFGNGGSGGAGGTASTSNNFSCMGFFQSITGQAGTSGGLTASTTTFLSGGNGATGGNTSNYGYSNNRNGFFQMQPIIVGSGGIGNTPYQGGIGCGGGGPNTGSAESGGNGGDGLVVIITW